MREIYIVSIYGLTWTPLHHCSDTVPCVESIREMFPERDIQVQLYRYDWCKAREDFEDTRYEGVKGFNHGNTYTSTEIYKIPHSTRRKGGGVEK